MKKIILLFVITSCCLFADWRDEWINGLEEANAENYAEAEKKFNQAIDEMEKKGVETHPQVYVDRGRLLLLLERAAESLPDFDKALTNKNISQSEKTRATVSRMIARTKVGGMDEGVLEDLNNLGKDSTILPVMEQTDDKIIIRNAPDCDCYKTIMKSFFIKSGICENENDIKILKSRTWIINKKITQKKLDCCTQFDREDLSDRASRRGDIEFCNAWCERAAIGGATWCGHAFKNIFCQIACGVAVFQLKQGCLWCCADGDFYKKCGSVFEDIAGALNTDGVRCLPFFD